MKNKNLILLLAAGAAYWYFFMYLKKKGLQINTPGKPDQPIPVQADTMPVVSTNSTLIVDEIKNFSSSVKNNVYQTTYGTIEGVDYKVPMTC